mgnify:CR=1 FL=1
MSEILLEKGHSVLGTFCNTEPSFKHPKMEWERFNVLDEEPLKSLPKEIHGFAYCPGNISLKPFHRVPLSDFMNDFNLQVKGAIRTVREALPGLKKSERGSILFFSTVAVQKGFAFHAQVAASKGAIEGLTRALAAEYAPAIRVNCLAPSLTDTKLAGKLLSSEEKKERQAERHPLKRIGTPEDLGRAGAFMLTEESSWVTGQILHIDGGLTHLSA